MKIFTVILLLFSIEIFAEDKVLTFQVAGKLYEYCQSENFELTAYCYGALTAIADAEIVNHVTFDRPLSFCIPSGVEPSQLSKVYLNYMDDNPQELHKVGAVAVMNSFEKAFPCK
ncbi:MAG: Rap1a/Tai family immunity protein [Gammaproteobacteria bacterium]